MDEGEQSSVASSVATGTNVPWLKIFLGVALVATLAGALVATKTLATIEQKVADAKENARPAAVQVTKLAAPECSDCFNIEAAMATLQQQQVVIGEIKTLPYASPEAQDLIKRLGIQRVPTYILTGEAEKQNLESFVKANGEVKDKTFIFTKVLPLFIDPTTNQKRGEVQATLITDSSCPSCLNPQLIVDAYRESGIAMSQETALSWDSPQARALIAQYNITKAPTLLLSPDIALYDEVQKNWTQAGTVEADGVHVLRNLSPPYRDLEKNQIVGLTDVLYLVDAACRDCYKPQDVQKAILTRRFGLGMKSERTVDIASEEGKRLVSTYKINQVPTVVLSPQADQYPSLKSVWPQVGTVESDGWYVFRQMSALGELTYKDLSKNLTIKPSPQPSPS